MLRAIGDVLERENGARRSSKVCSLMATLVDRSAKHNAIVVASKP